MVAMGDSTNGCTGSWLVSSVPEVVCTRTIAEMLTCKSVIGVSKSVWSNSRSNSAKVDDIPITCSTFNPEGALTRLKYAGDRVV